MVHFVNNSKLSELWPELSESALTEINDSITKRIQEHCRTTFEVINYTDEVQDSSYELILNHTPVVAVSSLLDNSVSLTEDTDFYVYPDKLIIESPSRKRKGIKISYSAGFSEVPELVKTVAYNLARYKKFVETEGSQLFYKSQVFEEREYEVADMSEEKILMSLAPYVQSNNQSTRRSNVRIGKM